MVLLTAGYSSQNFEFWVSTQRILYLYVFNIVYCIDVDGGYTARRRSDGVEIEMRNAEPLSKIRLETNV